MRTHDIIGDEYGWSHLVDGVLEAGYPSWYMALNAARVAAERDLSDGFKTTIRYQGLDGNFRPVLTGAAARRGGWTEYTGSRGHPRHGTADHEMLFSR
jgi:hypothetical protein